MKQVLDLSTIVDRPKVRIVSELHPDGQFYDMRTRDEMSVIEHQKVSERYRWVIEELETQDPAEMSEKQARMLTEALNDITRLVLDGIEPQVLAALDDGKKGLILRAWKDEFYPEAENEPDPT